MSRLPQTSPEKELVMPQKRKKVTKRFIGYAATPNVLRWSRAMVKEVGAVVQTDSTIGRVYLDYMDKYKITITVTSQRLK